MELRHLRYFRAVAEELHFGRAAKKLNIAQPPLSQQIKQLEHELGVQLFERTRPQIQLTVAGHEFLSRIHSVFIDIDTAIRETRKADRGEKGRLAIGFNVSASYDILPKVIKEYRSHYPGVDLDLRLLTTMEQVEALRNAQIQVGLLRTPVDEDVVEVQVIRRENFIIALPENHPMSVEKVIALDTLRDESFVMFPRTMGPDHYDEIITLFRASGFSPNIVLEVPQMQTNINLVSAGVGIAIVPESVQMTPRPGVVFRPLLNTTGFNIAVAWRKNDHSLLAQNFLSVTHNIDSRSSIH